MSHSLPSEEVYVVDVPEVKNFEANFEYNFYVPDEQINENSIIPNTVFNKKAEEADAEYIQYLQSRVPRYVKLTWKKSKSSDSGNLVSDADIRKNSSKISKYKF